MLPGRGSRADAARTGSCAEAGWGVLPTGGGICEGLENGFRGGLFFSILGGSDFWGWLAQTWHCGLGVVDGASSSV